MGDLQDETDLATDNDNHGEGGRTRGKMEPRASVKNLVEKQVKETFGGT